MTTIQTENVIRWPVMVLVLGSLSLAACNDSSSSSGSGGGGTITPQVQSEIDREDALIYLARAASRDLALALRATEFGQFQDDFSHPFTNTGTVTSPCGGDFISVTDTEDEFQATFDDCSFDIFNQNNLFDGSYSVTRGAGGPRGNAEHYEFSWLTEADNLLFGPSSSETLAKYWHGAAAMEFGKEPTAQGYIGDWELAVADQFHQDLQLFCSASLGVGSKASVGLELNDFEATNASLPDNNSTGGIRASLTQTGAIVISNANDRFNGRYQLATEELIRDNTNHLASTPESGKVSITGPGGFDIAVEFLPEGYRVTGGAVTNRLHTDVIFDPENSEPRSFDDIICLL